MSVSRFEFEVRVTVSGQNRSVVSHTSEITASGIEVPLPYKLAPGKRVELEMADSILYGQVLYSEPRATSFDTMIEVGRVALGSTELSRILQRVLLENLPETKGVEPAEAELD